MMSTSQERLVRRLIKSGGQLTLPGNQYPLQLSCDRASTGALWEIEKLEVREGNNLVTTYSRWQSRTLYPVVAELLDRLTADEVPA
jgi:hypothetical protein